MPSSISLTESNEDYLETMYNLQRLKGVIRVKDIAEKMGVKPPSVVEAVKKLSEIKLVSYEKYGNITLSEKGIIVAKGIINKHLILKNFLILLGIDKDTAEEEACAMEHVLSVCTVNRLEKFTKFMERYSKDNEDIMELFAQFEE